MLTEKTDYRVFKFADDFIEDLILLNEVENLRIDGKSIVFTNGVFDLIHKGHVKYLNDAKKLGDILIVGVNSDSSVIKIKGDKRPIVKEDERVFVLSSLKPVDYVVIFDEETPFYLIKFIKPDVLVKGSDWQEDQIVGSDFVKSYNGKVIRIDLVQGNSSTNIINSILDKHK